VVSNLVDALYEFGSGSQFGENDSRHAPLLLLTAHRAKGLEFDHVLILDGGGWQQASDEERRLFYVAMTRARKILTLCAKQGGKHAFIKDCEMLCIKTRPQYTAAFRQLGQRTWLADLGQVVLSWPGYFSVDKPIHQAIAVLDVGRELVLRPRSDGQIGWELADVKGVAVTRMAQAFMPPKGEIIQVRVAAVAVRHKTAVNTEKLRCEHWEVVLPEILYVPSLKAGET